MSTIKALLFFKNKPDNLLFKVFTEPEVNREREKLQTEGKDGWK